MQALVGANLVIGLREKIIGGDSPTHPPNTIEQGHSEQEDFVSMCKSKTAYYYKNRNEELFCLYVTIIELKN